MISSLLTILSAIAAYAKYIAARAQRRQDNGEGRTQAYAEAMKDAAEILLDLADVERSTIERLRTDRDGLLSAGHENRDNWPERNSEGKDV